MLFVDLLLRKAHNIVSQRTHEELWGVGTFFLALIGPQLPLARASGQIDQQQVGQYWLTQHPAHGRGSVHRR